MRHSFCIHTHTHTHKIQQVGAGRTEKEPVGLYPLFNRGVISAVWSPAPLRRVSRTRGKKSGATYSPVSTPWPPRTCCRRC